MFKICKNKQAEFIAINVDCDSFHHYYYLREILNETFNKSQISITIFLNKIVEIIERGDINLILDLYQKSLLGCHFGSEKKLKTISKFYIWNNMINDIKQFVKKFHRN